MTSHESRRIAILFCTALRDTVTVYIMISKYVLVHMVTLERGIKVRLSSTACQGCIVLISGLRIITSASRVVLHCSPYCARTSAAALAAACCLVLLGAGARIYC